MRNATAGMKTSLPISQPLWSGFIKDLCRSYGVIWIVVAMITFCSIQHTSAQGPYCISQNCTANDIQNPSYFLGNSTGIPIVSVVCIPGQPVNNVYLWLTFTVTATNRYDINVIGDVLIDGVYNHTFNVCLGDFGSGTYTVLLEQIIWPCGSEMVVSNNLFSWENNDDGNVPNTCNVCPSVPSKCHRYGDISISGPIVADFSIQSQCQFGQPFETFIFTNQTSGGATPYNNYSWDFGIGATAVPSTISGPNASGPFTVTYSSAGPRTITLTVTDHVGTVSTNTQTINVQATPIATVTSSGSTICAGGTSILNASLSGGTANTYQWQFNTAGTWTNVGSNQNTYQTPVLSVGTYTYRVVINQATSCPAVSPNSIVTAVALPTVNVTVDTICNGGTGLLTATVTGGAGTNSYQWQQLIGSTWTNVGTNPGYTTDVLTTVGTYTYRVILTQNSSGCFAISSNTTVTVVDDPTVSVTASDFIICDGESSTLTATVIGGTGIIIYQWQTISVGIWSNTGSNQNTYTTPALAVGTYTYRVMISQSSGCESVTDTVSTIQVNPIPNASIDAPTSNLCYFQFRTFKPVAPEVPGYYYHWDFGTGASLPPTTGYGPYNVKYSTTGTKTVQLIVFANAAGANCGDTTTISFLVVACPGNITGKVRDTLGVGIGSVNIKLFQDNNLDGLPDPNIPPTKSVNTVSSGVYSMVSIIPGQYVIVETQPVGYISKSDMDDTNDFDTLMNVNMNDNIIPCTIEASETDADNVFVEKKVNGVITGYVFKDLDNDLVVDNGEGLSGVTITLYNDVNHNGVPVAGNEFSTIQTSVLGFYEFGDLPNEDYILVESQPMGYVSSMDIDVSGDNDVVPNTNMMDDIIPVTITLAETDQDNYFTELQVFGQMVTNTNDSGPGSLRFVIDSAANGDTILFHSILQNQTIHLNSSRIEINKNIYINANTGSGIIIQSDISGEFLIDAGYTVQFKNLTINSGLSGYPGAAFDNKGHLILWDVTINRNPLLLPNNFLISNSGSGEVSVHGEIQIHN